MRKGTLADDIVGTAPSQKGETGPGAEMELGIGQGTDLEIDLRVDLEIDIGVDLGVGKAASQGTRNVTGIEVMRVGQGVATAGPRGKIDDAATGMGVKRVDQEGVAGGALTLTVEVEAVAETTPGREIAIGPDPSLGRELQKDQKGVVVLDL